MKLLIDLLHPAHVHFFKYIIDGLEKDHDITLTVRNKDVCLKLVKELGLNPLVTTEARGGSIGLANELVRRTLMIDNVSASRDCDILASISGTSIVPVAALRKKISLVFTDTEDIGLASWISYPWASRIITPACFSKDWGPKHIRYNGYQELAYLHPKYFQPDPQLLSQMGLSEGEPYFFLRFSSFSASHDIANHGFSHRQKKDLVKHLLKKGRVVISSEGPLPRGLEPFRYAGRVSDIHSFLYYANLYVGDSQTMSTEAALLGTPAIRCNSLVGTEHGSGNYTELKRKYGILYSIRNPRETFTKVKELVSVPDLKKIWLEKRNVLLREKEDVVDFVVRYINGIGSNIEEKTN